MTISEYRTYDDREFSAVSDREYLNAIASGEDDMADLVGTDEEGHPILLDREGKTIITDMVA